MFGIYFSAFKTVLVIANRDLAKSENPTATFIDISRILGQMWKGLSKEEQKTWSDAASSSFAASQDDASTEDENESNDENSADEDENRAAGQQESENA